MHVCRPYPSLRKTQAAPYMALSHPDFTDGCGISPHRLLGLLDSSAKRHYHRLGFTLSKEFDIKSIFRIFDIVNKFHLILKIISWQMRCIIINYSYEYAKNIHFRVLLLLRLRSVVAFRCAEINSVRHPNGVRFFIIVKSLPSLSWYNTLYVLLYTK